MPSIVALIALENPVELSAEDILTDLGQRWPDVPVSYLGDKKGTLNFDFDSANLAITLAETPLPWSELEEPARSSVSWPDAEAALRPHEAYVEVAVLGEGDPVEYAVRLTKAVATVLATTPGAIGVYWGSASLVVPRDLFIGCATEVLPLGPPIPIWVDFQVGLNEGDTTSGFTRGMTALGHMDMETLVSPESPAELVERMEGLARYVLERGPVIQSGDIVGRDHDEQIRVVYAESTFGNANRVMRLEYGPPAR
jgi:hypothetical protein